MQLFFISLVSLTFRTPKASRFLHSNFQNVHTLKICVVFEAKFKKVKKKDCGIKMMLYKMTVAKVWTLKY